MITFFQVLSEKQQLKAYLICASILLLQACSGSRNAGNESVQPSPAIDVFEAVQDSMEEVQPSVGIVEAEPDTQILYDDRNLFREPVSNFDVLSTTLDIAFNFAEQQVTGTAIHRLRANTDVLDTIRLQGRDMTFSGVSVRTGNGAFVPHDFQYREDVITIPLRQPVGRDQVLDVQLAYVANPRRNNSNLGLVFVDPLEIDASRPTQIWTLGQPEDNRYWFPAWDYPNDRMTFDLSLTVPQKYTTVANGQLVSQAPVAGGMRKDRWVLDKPHPSYLTGFAVGEYAAVVDTHTREDGSTLPLAYFVEPQQVANAQLVFGSTPGMMAYFERKLGIAYPWNNYKQVAVRDFTARGMENTTATIMYDQLQHDERAHLDYSGVDLIAHELAHQWFGNLLTCRNWAHLPLNEGFASYFERLYMEEAVGMGAAQYHTITDRQEYFEEARQKMRPVIWFNYTDPNQLYDRHTYQKAGLVLHQLRHILGEDIWWQGVRKYVRDNAFEEVVLEDLQQAMEAVSRKSLSGYFNQWFRRPGHPVLDVTHTYDKNRGLYDVRVQQTQDEEAIGNFAFDVDIEVNMQGFAPWTSRYRVASRDTTFHIATAGLISFVRFDAGDWLLARVEVEKEAEEWINQLRLDDEMAGRLDAARALAEFGEDERIRDELTIVIGEDSSPFVRKAAIEALAAYAQNEQVRNALVQRVRQDTDAKVRKAALQTLSAMPDEQLNVALDAALLDRSYQVVAAAIEMYSRAFPELLARSVRSLYDLESWEYTVERALIRAYGAVQSLEGIPYIERYLGERYGEDVQVVAVEALASIAQRHSDVRNSILNLLYTSLESIHEPVRYAVASSLRSFRQGRTSEIAREKMQNEQSARVREALQQLIVP